MKSAERLIFATDYDETIATQGLVSPECIKALGRMKDAGWLLILVTGRRLEELRVVFPALPVFNRVVAENGGLIFNPETGEELLIAKAPPEKLVSFLKDKNVPIAVGRVLVASLKEYAETIEAAIEELGLRYHVIPNKESVMILPAAIDKATGLKEVLTRMGLSQRATVGVGDGENDRTFLAGCRLGVAVQNAVLSLKESADIVTSLSDSQGVCELIALLMSDGFLKERRLI